MIINHYSIFRKLPDKQRPKLSGSIGNLLNNTLNSHSKKKEKKKEAEIQAIVTTFDDKSKRESARELLMLDFT